MRDLYLLTALGTRDDLLLQMLDFFNGGERFAYNAEAAAIRERFRDCRIGELHLLCTGAVMERKADTRKILAAEYPGVEVTFIPLECDDIGCGADDAAMRDIVYKTVAALAGPDLVIASAGRKTITQRIMEAGIMYGCAGYLTLTASQGIERRDDVRFHTEKFNVIWSPAANFYQEKRSRLIRDEIGDTFRSLYLLPNWLIDRLREERIGRDPAAAPEELTWLVQLPKTDLHCHLGGAYDMALLKELAATLLDDTEMTSALRKGIRAELEKKLGRGLAELTPDTLRRLNSGAVHCLANLGRLYQSCGVEKHLAHAVLVDSLSEEQLGELAADGGKMPGAGSKLSWYMSSGDLGGSGLLQSENTLKKAVAWLVRRSAEDGVRYLEIRFSPGNYTRAGLAMDEVVETIQSEAARTANARGMTVNLLLMATRHKAEEAMSRHVEAAVRAAGRQGPCRVVGFDLAGQEEDNPPERFSEIFDPLHKNFIDVTIHAGEMDEDDKIWQAMYRLHAKRIGHGLKLVNNPRMMDYVRDWGIAVEMCPTSNRQTNRFRRFDQEERGPAYPLKKYLDHGIRVTVNTDNPGISNTSAGRELLMAARLTEGGLSRWDILRLIRNGFKSSFLPRDEKDRLLKDVDKRIFELLLQEL